MARRIYGGHGTIEKGEYLKVEVDLAGDVVAVWFRGMLLPFEAHHVDEYRARILRDRSVSVKLTAVEVDDR